MLSTRPFVSHVPRVLFCVVQLSQSRIALAMHGRLHKFCLVIEDPHLLRHCFVPKVQNDLINRCLTSNWEEGCFFECFSAVFWRSMRLHKTSQSHSLYFWCAHSLDLQIKNLYLQWQAGTYQSLRWSTASKTFHFYEDRVSQTVSVANNIFQLLEKLLQDSLCNRPS